jgi:hypothetical protein
LFFLYTALFSWGAVYSRFPLVYSDTGTDLSSALTLIAPGPPRLLQPVPARRPRLRLASLVAGVLAQAALLARLLLLTIEKVRPDAKAGKISELNLTTAQRWGKGREGRDHGGG